MNKTQKSKLMTEIVDSYLNEKDNDKKNEAFRRLMTMEKLEAEIDLKQQERDQKDRELNIREDENEAREELEKEKLELEKEKQKLEEKKVSQDAEFEALKLRAEKRNRICTVICSALSAAGGVAGTILGLKFYDRQINKAYQFEETGSVTSFTGKQTLSSALKLPKK